MNNSSNFSQLAAKQINLKIKFERKKEQVFKMFFDKSTYVKHNSMSGSAHSSLLI